MDAEDIGQNVEPLKAPPRLTLAALKGEKRGFQLGLLGAVVLHALLIFGWGKSLSTRQMGERNGAADGVSVVLVNEADFKSKYTVPIDQTPPPGDPNARPQPEQPEKTPPQPAERTPEQQQQQQQEQSQQQPAERAPQPPQKSSAAALEKETPDLLAVPDLASKPPDTPAKREQKQQQQRQQQHAQPKRPDLSAKPDKSARPTFPGERYASFARPAGITRSGENDDFARGVIRALQQTMPHSRGPTGRVTIRFLLTETGNLAEVHVVATSTDASLTQNVVFASKQSNFPIPPSHSTVADRTFLVTYVYE